MDSTPSGGGSYLGRGMEGAERSDEALVLVELDLRLDHLERRAKRRELDSLVLPYDTRCRLDVAQLEPELPY